MAKKEDTSTMDFGKPVAPTATHHFGPVDPFAVPSADPNYHYYHALKGDDIVQGVESMKQDGYEVCEGDVHGRSRIPGHVLMRKSRAEKEAKDRYMDQLVDGMTKETNRRAVMKQADGFNDHEIATYGGITNGSIR